MDAPPQSRKTSALGVIFTFVVTIGFVWASVRLYRHYAGPSGFSAADAQANELLAFESLKLVVKAQEQYKEVDWDEDGRKTYAEFLVHLWTCIDAKDDPVPVGLIPNELAFAM